MRGQETFLAKFFHSTKPLVVPVYQRNYTWRKENCKLLFDDILNICNDERKKHFIGSVVFVDHADSFIVIDGQQRITTISILLLALRNAIRDGEIEVSNPSLANQIEYEFLVNQFSSTEEHRMKLKPFRDDCKAYDALFGDAQNYIETSQITINYKFFYNELISQNVDATKFYEAIKNRLEFVQISLEPQYGDNAQLVFETINSTGVSLNETDKIRNFVLMNLDAKRQEHIYNNYWLPIEISTNIYMEDFMRDYLTMRLNYIPNRNDVYKVFKDFVLENYTTDVEPLLADLKYYATIFKSIKESKIGTNKANAIMTDLEQLELTTTYPFLLALLAYHKQGGISDNEVEKVLGVLEVFLFRRIMSGFYNTGLNKIFVNLHNRIIKMMYDNFTYLDVFIYLLQHGITYWEFPNDEKFKVSFEEREVYKMRSNYRLYLFYKFEEAMNKEAVGTKMKIEDGVLSIEHIMPQTLSDDWKIELGDITEEEYDKWLHNIGNLTLTAYNSEYSNRKFSEKRDGIPTLHDMKGFKDSCVAMNKYVSEQEHWTLQNIKTRCNWFAEQACKIWPYPTTHYKPIVSEEEFIPIDAEFEFKGRYIKCYRFEGLVVNVDSWADAFTRIVKTLYEKDNSKLNYLAQNPQEGFYEIHPEEGFNQISENLYLKVACNTHNKLRQLYRLLTMYEYETDAISIVLHPQRKTE